MSLIGTLLQGFKYNLVLNGINSADIQAHTSINDSAVETEFLGTSQ